MAQADDPDLHRLCGEFAGARPYLELLAQAPGAGGPLDPEVVEAYWVGGPLLQALRPQAFQADLERRVRPRATADDWRWLAGKPADGAVPHHAFHVLEIYPRLGLTGDGSRDALLATMERCLVRPARVTARDGDELLVMARPLVVEDGRFASARSDPSASWPPSTAAASWTARSRATGSPSIGAGPATCSRSIAMPPSRPPTAPPSPGPPRRPERMSPLTATKPRQPPMAALAHFSTVLSSQLPGSCSA